MGVSLQIGALERGRLGVSAGETTTADESAHLPAAEGVEDRAELQVRLPAGLRFSHFGFTVSAVDRGEVIVGGYRQINDYEQGWRGTFVASR